MERGGGATGAGDGDEEEGSRKALRMPTVPRESVQEDLGILVFSPILVSRPTAARNLMDSMST